MVSTWCYVNREHQGRSVQLGQSGLRAMHTARPWSTTQWQKSLDSSGGRTWRSCCSTFTRIHGAAGKPQTAGNPNTVVSATTLQAHNIRCPGSGRRSFCLHQAALKDPPTCRALCRHTAPISSGRPLQCLWLWPGKAGGVDIGLYFVYIGLSQRFQSGKTSVEGRRLLVDPLVRTLGGQTNGK